MKDKNTSIYCKEKLVNKHVKRYYHIDHIPYVQNYLYEHQFACPPISSSRIIDSMTVEYEYPWVDGENVNSLTEDTISQIFSIIDQLQTATIEKICSLTIFDKISIYLREIDNLSLDKNLKDQIDHWKRLIDNVHYHYTLSHGDMDLSNLVIDTTGKINLIDFDECCLAPRDMDRAIFLVRLLHKHQLAPFLSPKDETWLIDKLYELNNELIEIYIAKVVIEKIYLLHKGIIDINDSEQKNDNIQSWLLTLDSIRYSVRGGKHEKECSGSCQAK